MTAPTSVPAAAFTESGWSTTGLWHAAFRSMASPVRLQLGADTPRPDTLSAAVRALFADVEQQCTRFDPRSDLMRANALGDTSQPVGAHCFAALRAAAEAHQVTGGRFEPRVLAALVGLGYREGRQFAEGPVQVEDVAAAAPVPPAPWAPEFDEAGRAVRIGPVPVDLGGIGKGLALRWAAELLRAGGCTTFLLDAGGDCVFGGQGPDGEGWRIGVEDPAGGSTPVAVLQVGDGACATSSVRLRSWRAGGRRVHHLIDPRTGQPGGAGLQAVTVHGTDPAEAEVWSKVLFLEGADRIAAAAREHRLAALWLADDGTLGTSATLEPAILWRAS